MKYLIVGGVAGGASTAARLRRLDESAEIIMFERGNYISYANCGLPYYIGELIYEREKLFVQTPESFAARFNIEARVRSEVERVNPEKKTITVHNLDSGGLYEETYDKLILSPGAAPVRPPLEGIDSEGIFTLRNVNDTDRVKVYIEENDVKRALIVGAGFIGLEMAENLHEYGIQVSVVEMSDQVMTPVDYEIATVVHQHFKSKGVGLHLQEAVTAFRPVEDGIDVVLKSGLVLQVDMVLLSIGVRPDVKLAREAGLEIGETGGIKVNEFLQTSHSDIYAVGDAIEFPNPVSGRPFLAFLAGPANKQGRICADNVVNGNHQKYRGSISTAIAKVFDLTVGATGLSAKMLDRLQIPYKEAIVHGASHAGYYPGAIMMDIKINFSPEVGRIFQRGFHEFTVEVGQKGITQAQHIPDGGQKVGEAVELLPPARSVGVIAHEGRKEAEFQPAEGEVRGGVLAEAAEVSAAVEEAAHLDGGHHLDIGQQLAPRGVVVAQPDAAPTVCPDDAAAAVEQGALAGAERLERLTGGTGHAAAVEVVDAVMAHPPGSGVVVEAAVILGGVHQTYDRAHQPEEIVLVEVVLPAQGGSVVEEGFQPLGRVEEGRLIHIVPEPLNAEVSERLILPAEPCPGLGTEKVGEVGLAGPDRCDKRRTVLLRAEIAFLEALPADGVAVVAANACVDDGHKTDALGLEVGGEPSEVGETVFVHREISIVLHIINVHADHVQRQVVGFILRGHFPDVGLGLVAEAAVVPRGR